MAKKVYVKGSAKEIKFKDGSLLRFTLKVSQLVKILDYLNGKREESGKPPTDYLNFDISELRNGEDEYGNTHKVRCDLWYPGVDEESDDDGDSFRKPNKGQGQKKAAPRTSEKVRPSSSSVEDDDELPF